MLTNFLNFQVSSTPVMEGIRDLHDYVFIFLFFVLSVVMVVFGFILNDFYKTYKDPSNAEELLFREDLHAANKVSHGVVLEIVWTLIPSVILVLIAFPSFVLLYAMDELIDPLITLKVVGHQWYWVYEYSDYLKNEGFKEHSFESYMVYTDELKEGQFRLLEVDNSIVLPTNTHVRVLITAGDVLHSWAVPSLGVKMDAVPGRLNQVSVFLKREGVFYGQCSELCGVNHGFMPIVLKAVSFDEYLNWVKTRA